MINCQTRRICDIRVTVSRCGLIYEITAFFTYVTTTIYIIAFTICVPYSQAVFNGIYVIKPLNVAWIFFIWKFFHLYLFTILNRSIEFSLHPETLRDLLKSAKGARPTSYPVDAFGVSFKWVLAQKITTPLLPENDRVDCAKILGVHFSDTLIMISQCNQRLFLLSQLKHQGLSVEAMSVIFTARRRYTARTSYGNVAG